jgi:hypothetical protein
MSKRKEAPGPEVSRPCLFDHLAILAGLALSIYLMRLAPLTAEPTNPLDPRVAQVFGFLVVLIRLPEGIVLLWPIFFATQWFGRSDGLTAGEWLWLLCWGGLLVLTALTVWGRVLGFPEWMYPYADKPRLLWYLLLTPALAALALVVLIVDLFRSYVPPWTHQLGLALLLWPAPAALVVLAGGELRPE